jgi:hypothetical protein
MFKSMLFATALAAAAVTTPAIAATNLVVNGSFETGDFTGWTLTGDTTFVFVTDETGGGGPTDGIYHAAFGPEDGLTYLSQAIATTPGENYAFRFDLANLDGAPNEFTFDLGATTLIDLVDSPAFDYATAEGFFTAASSSTTIRFGFYQLPFFFVLDNVSVTSMVPEPASWALLVTGFGMVGASMRRRKVTVAA